MIFYYFYKKVLELNFINKYRNKNETYRAENLIKYAGNEEKFKPRKDLINFKIR